MAQVKFYLKDKHAKEDTLINLFFSFSGKRLKWYTGHSIHPKDWSFPNKLPKRKPELTQTLKNYAAKVKEIHASFLAQEINPTTTQIRDKLNEIYRDEAIPEETLLSYLGKFVDHNPKNFAHNTLKQYKTLHRHLSEFVEATGYNLKFKTVNGNFDESFFEYLTNKEQPLSPSSVNKVYGIFKAFMTYATRKGFNTNMLYQTFQHKRKKTLQIALTRREVEKLEALQLSGIKELYRDIFLFSCETAMEFSAVSKLKPTDIKEKTFRGINDGEQIKYAEYYRSKTGGKVTPPLSEKALAIMEKYDDPDRETCFPKLNNQVYNRSLKEVGQLAGITEPIEVVSYEGANKKTSVKPKYELMTSHTGRRTFVTLFIESGGTNEACRVYTGHATNKQLDNYRKDTLLHKMTLAFSKEKPNRKMEKVS